jgi:uncharacterized membrane protein YhaH (DUF805 family)
MDYVWYLFRFDGRINRARCWLAGLILISWMIFLALLLAGIAHLFGATMPHEINFGPNEIFGVLDPQVWRSLPKTNLTALMIHTVITPLALWVYLATSAKRLHDRDKNGWWIVLFFVLPCLYGQFGARLEDWLGDSYFAILPSTIAFVFSVWGFVEMYCRKGTTGTNRFGADPLAPIDTRPPWDQQSEVEMVPHKANAHFPKFAFPRGDYLSRTSESDGH